MLMVICIFVSDVVDFKSWYLAGIFFIVDVYSVRILVIVIIISKGFGCIKFGKFKTFRLC
jgi:hypothetical protein